LSFLRRLLQPQPPPVFGFILPRETRSMTFATVSPKPCGRSNFSSQIVKQIATLGREYLLIAQHPPLLTLQSRQCVHLTISSFGMNFVFAGFLFFISCLIGGDNSPIHFKTFGRTSTLIAYISFCRPRPRIISAEIKLIVFGIGTITLRREMTTTPVKVRCIVAGVVLGKIAAVCVAFHQQFSNRGRITFRSVSNPTSASV